MNWPGPEELQPRQNDMYANLYHMDIAAIGGEEGKLFPFLPRSSGGLQLTDPEVYSAPSSTIPVLERQALWDPAASATIRRAPPRPQ